MQCDINCHLLTARCLSGMIPNPWELLTHLTFATAEMKKPQLEKFSNLTEVISGKTGRARSIPESLAPEAMLCAFPSLGTPGSSSDSF